MNDEQKQATPAEQLQHATDRLVWLAQDLQRRVSMQENPETGLLVLGEIQGAVTSIVDLLHSAQGANTMSPASPPRGDRPPAIATDKATPSISSFAGETASEGTKRLRPPKGGA
jgi:hypothetical protein